MELLCALLTGFFLWLLVYQWRRKSITRWRHLAGGHLCTAESTRPRRVRWAFFAYFSFMLLGHVASAVFWHTRSNLESQFGVAGVFTLVLLLGIPVTRNIALEVREHGVFCGKVGDRVSTRRLHFVPWNLIAACQWVPKSFGVISRFDNVLNRLTIAQEAVPLEEKTAVTAALGQFVPVYDHDGVLLAEPDAEHRVARWIHWRDLDRPPFQFDLQTMLLLVVVVACAASLAGIRYRSPEHQAVMKLEAFDPKIDYYGRDDIYELDFSSCANKPTDDNLVYLEPLSELAILDLSGAPITDAGLAHLKGLKNLRHLNLTNTGVTDRGMADLRRALPDANIGKQVLWVPPNLVPLAPTPPKGKTHR